MKKIIQFLAATIIALSSPISSSSVLSDKMTGTQSQTNSKTIMKDGAENKTNTQSPEKTKDTVVNNPKLDEIIGLSSSKVKMFIGIFVVIGFFIYGFGRYFLTGKQ